MDKEARTEDREREWEREHRELKSMRKLERQKVLPDQRGRAREEETFALVRISERVGTTWESVQVGCARPFVRSLVHRVTVATVAGACTRSHQFKRATIAPSPGINRRVLNVASEKKWFFAAFEIAVLLERERGRGAFRYTAHDFFALGYIRARRAMCY